MIIATERINGSNPEGMAFHMSPRRGSGKYGNLFSIIIISLRDLTTMAYNPKQQHMIRQVPNPKD